MKNRNFALFFVMLFLSLLFLTNCDASDKGKNEKDNAMLFYYEKASDNKFNCCIKYLPEGDSIVLCSFDKIPLDALWDTIEKTVSFITTDGIYKCNYQQKTALQKISDNLPNDIAYGESWIDSASNKIMFSYYISYSKLTEPQKKLYADLSAKAEYLPAWGDSGIAFINIIDSNGKWNIFANAATKTAAGLTPGFSVLNKFCKAKNRNIFSAQSFFTDCTCLAQVMKNKNISYLDTSQYGKYSIDKTLSKNVSEFKIINVSDKFDLIIATAYGDSPHYTAPVLLVNKETNVTKKLVGLNYDQLGLFINNDYVMFANEYDNSNPKVFSKKTFDQVFDKPSAMQAIIIKR